ncbi:hypothetical protein [[Pseudomonas] boreopolis]|uniref:hypothetical protein n=1 Tax=Xanthomonas boreopolis TaxID=86183 RepID=UPI003DA0C094
MDLPAYLLYLAWIAAGLGDFALHRRSDLPHTSGLAESRLHLAQLCVVGSGVLAWWALEATSTAWGVLALAALAHAVLGYADTCTAYGKRVLSPLEQHVHSVLDIAPWILLGWAALGVDWHDERLRLEPRAPGVLLALLAPALLPVTAASWEFAQAWRVAKR